MTGAGGFSPRAFLTHMRAWGGRIRTYECRLQRAMPYHLATPQARMRINRIYTPNNSGYYHKIGLLKRKKAETSALLAVCRI